MQISMAVSRIILMRRWLRGKSSYLYFLNLYGDMSPMRTAGTSGFTKYILIASEPEAVKNILFVASHLKKSLCLILLPTGYFD
jgi:hypothetical protein